MSAEPPVKVALPGPAVETTVTWDQMRAYLPTHGFRKHSGAGMGKSVGGVEHWYRDGHRTGRVFVIVGGDYEMAEAIESLASLIEYPPWTVLLELAGKPLAGNLLDYLAQIDGTIDVFAQSYPHENAVISLRAYISGAQREAAQVLARLPLEEARREAVVRLRAEGTKQAEGFALQLETGDGLWSIERALSHAAERCSEETLDALCRLRLAQRREKTE